MPHLSIIVHVYAFASALTIFVGAANVTDKDNCTKPEGPANCCANYIGRDDGLCHPCENGTYGVKCGLRCPRFQYGRFCEGRCNCSDRTDCDPRNGKCSLGKAYHMTPIPYWSIAVAFVCEIILFIGVLSCCLYYLTRGQPSLDNTDVSIVHDFLNLLASRRYRPDTGANNNSRSGTASCVNVSTSNQFSSYNYTDTSQRKGNHNHLRCLKHTLDENRKEVFCNNRPLAVKNFALRTENVFQTDSDGYLIPVANVREAQ